MPKPARSNAGNVFLALFGAIAVAGVLGAALSGVMKGPLISSVQLTRTNTAENQMAQGAKSLVTAAASLANHGDCDGDGLVEPWEWRDAGGLPHPIGGGLVPTSVLNNPKDPWGTEYGYCVWDHGAVTLNPTCRSGTVDARLQGANTRSAPAVAIISAGPDKVFTTTCRNFSAGADRADQNNNGLLGDAGDRPMISKAANADDDILFTYTYEEAVSASGGLWSLKPTDATTATIAKSLEIAGSASISDTGLFGKIGKSSSIAAPADCTGLGDAYYNHAASGHCYYKVTGSYSWQTAKDNCQAQGGYLVSITSAQEQAMIEAQLVPAINTWIGATAQAVAGEWRWSGGPETNTQFWQGTSTGSAVGGMYSYWATNEPGNNNTCAVIDSSKGNKWRAAGSCGSTINYICEKTGSVAGVGGALEIDTGVRLASPTEMPTCNAINKGSVRSNTTEDGLEICDGTSWATLGGEGGGSGGIAFPLLAPNGTAAAPSYSFTSSSGSGLYYGSSNLKIKSAGTFEAKAAGQVTMAGATNDFRISSAGGLKIGNDTGVCSPTIQGTLRYNSSTKKFEFCDGAGWSVFAGAPSPSGGGGTGPQDCTGLGVAHYNIPGGHCYFQVSGSFTWSAAQSACQASGGYLAVISSEAEMNDFYNGMSMPEGDGGWVGATDSATENQWVWTGGELDGVQFFQGDPSGGGSLAGGATYAPWWSMTAGAYVTPQGDANGGGDCMALFYDSGISDLPVAIDGDCSASTVPRAFCEKGM